MSRQTRLEAAAVIILLVQWESNMFSKNGFRVKRRAEAVSEKDNKQIQTNVKWKK